MGAPTGQSMFFSPFFLLPLDTEINRLVPGPVQLRAKLFFPSFPPAPLHHHVVCEQFFFAFRPTEYRTGSRAAHEWFTVSANKTDCAPYKRKAFARPSTGALHHDRCRSPNAERWPRTRSKRSCFQTDRQSFLRAQNDSLQLDFKSKNRNTIEIRLFFPSLRFTRFSVVHSPPPPSPTVAQNRTNLYLTDLNQTQLTCSMSNLEWNSIWICNVQSF